MNTAALPLFPLQAVLFPGMRLQLKVFEARYLDLVARCLREGGGFGVVCLRQGHEVRRGGEPVRLEDTGVLARLDEVDAEGPGLLRVRCTGGQRFTLAGAPAQADGGLWQAAVTLLDDDPALAPTPEHHACVRALAQAIASLESQGSSPFDKPYRWDDAAWVGNRWCELLPITLAAKQKLMALPDPLVRLTLVGDFLRGKGVLLS